MHPSVLIVAAHPDDETVGAASLLLSAGRAAVVHLTDGAPRDPRLRPPAHRGDRDAYARVRRSESLAALEEAGVAALDVVALGAVDQEATGEVARLAREVARVLAVLRPRIAVVHPFEGGHPDHDAAAIVARAAAALLARRAAPVPRLVEMTSYHLRGERLECGAFLDGPPGLVRPLPPPALAAKRRMLAHYESQREVLAGFPVAPERFRDAPAVSLARRPHPAPLHYELRGWARFEDVRDALRAGVATLGLAESAWA